ncbi:hypothetical protein [Candidatus Hecatella orcuttiae]|jgi:hypothetical protein|uniref:hypothetical protein n=1 Tax=Candidatus Hecatella orcuttiae TaxID=1935119 RepID=UPI002867C84C|nr:hypothetical protein [Candidatus Hecatella orcuttiae]
MSEDKLVGIEAFEGGWAHKKFLDRALKERAKILARISREEAGKLAEAVGGRLTELLEEAAEWVIVVSPLPKLEVYYVLKRYAPEFEDVLQAFYRRKDLELSLPAEDISEFTVLYANALIYAARQILGKDDLPHLSRYL